MDILNILYNTAPGRVILKPLSSRFLSDLSGKLMDTKASMCLIDPFVKKNGIDVDEYDISGVNSFNSFFCRPVNDGARPVCSEADALISPCDGLLTVLPIREDTVIHVKQSSFNVSGLLQSEKIASRYEGGVCLVFRLCVDNYHRYCYVDSGEKSRNAFIPGVLHTVRPVALEREPVFTENCREYCLIRTENFGTIVQMEVGAMLVGKIKNELRDAGNVVRGEEKGHFEYGGSTIVVLIKKGVAELLPEIMANSFDGVETPVKMGEKIGERHGR